MGVGLSSGGSFLEVETVDDAAVIVEVVALEVGVAVEEEEVDLLFFLEPPPTGTFLRDPPSVQYLLQVLQKYLGCVRL